MLLETGDTALLLIDHQSGLLQTVRDVTLSELRVNMAVLARLATIANLPVITTASVPEGPNGPLLPEIARHAPHAVYVPRAGEVNAWDNPNFVRAVENTGKRTLLVAGIWTSVCVAFPALSARAAGYAVHAVLDASGDMSKMASDITMARLVQAGVVPVSTSAVVACVQKTWNRPDAAQFFELYADFAPSYRGLIECHQAAQAAARQTP